MGSPRLQSWTSTPSLDSRVSAVSLSRSLLLWVKRLDEPGSRISPFHSFPLRSWRLSAPQTGLLCWLSPMFCTGNYHWQLSNPSSSSSLSSWHRSRQLTPPWHRPCCQLSYVSSIKHLAAVIALNLHAKSIEDVLFFCPQQCVFLEELGLKWWKKLPVQGRESGFSVSAVIRRCQCFRAEVSPAGETLLSPAANHLPSPLTGLFLQWQRWRQGVRQEPVGYGFITAGNGWREVWLLGSEVTGQSSSQVIGWYGA